MFAFLCNPSKLCFSGTWELTSSLLIAGIRCRIKHIVSVRKMTRLCFVWKIESRWSVSYQTSCYWRSLVQVEVLISSSLVKNWLILNWVFILLCFAQDSHIDLTKQELFIKKITLLSSLKCVSIYTRFVLTIFCVHPVLPFSLMEFHSWIL